MNEGAAAGRVVADLQDPDGGFRMPTSVLEIPGWLFLGSLVEPTAARLRWETSGAPPTP